ncbi:hypothetical protein F5Y03DRAFT_100525 [Xylaria venustula]|nr:hypothetical protein F5Y03DRAFT_100525 [Xylaria venustula]
MGGAGIPLFWCHLKTDRVFTQLSLGALRSSLVGLLLTCLVPTATRLCRSIGSAYCINSSCLPRNPLLTRRKRQPIYSSMISWLARSVSLSLLFLPYRFTASGHIFRVCFVSRYLFDAVPGAYHIYKFWDWNETSVTDDFMFLYESMTRHTDEKCTFVKGG